MAKTRVKAWSVAAEKILSTAASKAHAVGMPDEVKANILSEAEKKAHDQAVADTFGANWKENVDAQGRPQETGIGSTLWLLRVSEEEAENHFSALSRWRGPAAERAERERIARLKGKSK